jgi:hypothetical protein
VRLHDFTCANGDAIERPLVCNGLEDCTDGSDEDGVLCARFTFLCDNAATIASALTCNGEDDCGDGSDEAFCASLGPYFACADESALVPHPLLCDGVDDCTDGSDEVGCYPCVTGQEAFRGANCDGIVDCADNSDEIDCFACSEGGQIIPGPFECNGSVQCDDGSDEVACFECANGDITRFLYACDNIVDCLVDASDEAFTCSPIVLSYICDDASNVVPQPLYCGYGPQCDDGSDEGAWCESYQFLCANGDPIPPDWYCDGLTDCDDGSDEIPCLDRLFVCDSTVISRTWVCDGAPDCDDGTDESADLCDRLVFACAVPGGGPDTIPRALACDGEPDCDDMSDEGAFCDQLYEVFLCATVNEVIPATAVCDEILQCSDGSDEADCP